MNIGQTGRPPRRAGEPLAHEAQRRTQAQVQQASLQNEEAVDRELVPQHVMEEINETEKYQMSDHCRRDYRNRIRRIILFWKANANQDYIATAIREVPTAEYENESNYFFPSPQKRYALDIVYSKMSYEWYKFFLTDAQKLDNGNLASPTHIRKFRDAVLWGSQQANDPVPATFWRKIEAFHKGYRKKIAQHKKHGTNVADSAADPITIALYQKLLKRTLEENNVMAWHWTQLQWNLMARSASVDPLHVKNFRLGNDSIIIKYDDSKADKQAKHLAEKNIYPNNKNWRMCVWTGLGVYMALR